jgi:hypothetical protein
MIKDVRKWLEFERDFVAAQRSDYAENLRLLDGMYDYARKLGKLTADDALDGIEKTIRVARVINCVRGPS